MHLYEPRRNPSPEIGSHCKATQTNMTENKRKRNLLIMKYENIALMNCKIHVNFVNMQKTLLKLKRLKKRVRKIRMKMKSFCKIRNNYGFIA